MKGVFSRELRGRSYLDVLKIDSEAESNWDHTSKVFVCYVKENKLGRRIKTFNSYIKFENYIRVLVKDNGKISIKLKDG